MQEINENNPKGVDVSHYQGVPDWPQVAGAGYSFAFIKATEGAGIVDDCFLENLRDAKNAGLAVGAYHFLRAGSVEEAVAEADHYIAAVNQVGFDWLDLPPVVDVETDNGPGLEVATARAYVDRIKEVTGLEAMIYTYPSFVNEQLDASLGDIKLWYASYGNNDPADRGGWSHWTFLQATDKGQVPGIDVPVDINYYSGSVEELMGYTLKVEDANKVIGFLGAAYASVDDPGAHAEYHRLANELRKASNQPVSE